MDGLDHFRYSLVPYTRGRVFSIGGFQAFPHWVSIGQPDCSLFATGVADAVVVWDIFDKLEEQQKAAQEWWRLLRTGGHLILYRPKSFDPKKLGTWDLVHKDGDLYVYQSGGPEHRFSGLKSKPEKRCVVVRYGGIGDIIQTASVIAGLKKEGWHITVNTYELGRKILQHDPNVDAFLIQDADQVPNDEVGKYWHWLGKQFDRCVNLSESVETSLLATEGRAPWYWSKAARHRYMNHNYLEFSHDIASLPYEFKPKFYPTSDEREWAAKERSRIGGKLVVLYSLSGSSVHKTWPHLDELVAKTLTLTDAIIVLVGGKECRMLELPWRNEPRVIRRSGEWSVRQTLTFAIKQADIVIGPETGILNAVSHETVPKVCLLSHSTKENLTKHWINTTAIEPPPSVDCYPCHRLHKNFDYCRVGGTGTALCQEKIPADIIFGAMMGLLKHNNRLEVA